MSNRAEAQSLASATTTVLVSGAAAPSSGQVLKATGPTAATWQGLTSSDVGLGSVTNNAQLPLTGGTMAGTVIWRAGTTAAGTAPIKFQSGALLTAPEVGAMEFLTDAWYGTITTGAARKTFAFLESPIFTGSVGINQTPASSALQINQGTLDGTLAIFTTGAGNTAKLTPLTIGSVDNATYHEPTLMSPAGLRITSNGQTAQMRHLCSGNNVYWQNTANGIMYFTGLNGVATSATWFETTTAIFNGTCVTSKANTAGIKVDPAAPTFPWRELWMPVHPMQNGAGNPTPLAYRDTHQFQWAFALNDVIDYRFVIPHDYVMGSNLQLTWGWSHNGTAITGNAVFDTYHTYCKNFSQGTFPAEKTLQMTHATVNVATTPQYQQISEELQISVAGGSATQLILADIEPGGFIMGQMVLSGLPTITGGSLFIHCIGIRYQTTNLGTKSRTGPTFWT